MNKKTATKWIKALRSGKFLQVGEALKQERDDGKMGHCCLGVLGEICGISKDYLESNACLERTEARLECDIMDSEGTPRDKNGDLHLIKLRIGNQFKEFPNLASANDGGASFKSIATWIEKNYKLL